MRAAILIGLAAGSWAAAAPGPKDPPPKPSPLVGEWRLVSQTSQGNTRPWRLDDTVFAFTADGRYARYEAGAKEKARWQEYRADDKADPPTLDVFEPGGKGDTKRWLYRVDGDTLTVCMPEDATAGRPAAIEAGKGSKNWVLTLKRVAPKK
jgi:uncharacterized protein (TIGR03067 family)